MAIVAVLVVAAVGATAVDVLNTRQQSAEARTASAHYTPPPIPSPPSGAPVVGKKGDAAVTIIGDDFTVQDSSGVKQYWPDIAAKAAKVRATIFADSGAGYLAEPEDGEGAFPASAVQLDKATKAVILFGGANDAAASTLSIYRAATSTVSAAQSAAPKATVVMVGPAWPVSKVPAQILRMRDVLRAAASLGRIRFVDPIAERWLTASDDLNPNGATLTRKGQESIATHMTAVLRAAAH